MAQSHLVSRLPFSEPEHGWALDVGSFLAAWCTAFRGLVQASTPEARVLLVRYCRLYAHNITSRLATHGVVVDSKVFEPKNFQQMDEAVVEVTNKVRKTRSVAHCAFVSLGRATTLVELGMKPGMANEYYAQHRESATSAIKQLLQLCKGRFPAEMQAEAIRIELLQLGGNVDNVRRVLLGSGRASSNVTRIAIDEARDKRIASVRTEEELPRMMAEAAI
ncbi:hypothetical protein M409DRAFT_57176 [Zasmidium cellare ATCC 36951]|uniref:Uncharacterized protein n=1 Tax=Zasmidium cellare ATCC 36951 TaxID=1080233 RepID=A0A6A6CE24_ZASCE|nr:uncharacterized protein M409DRAFT_57176 [Zasmidium cellare ATCC 36951]KAF2163676.1 hypothetical protein M409DRAFT_57176 [Zasmidium cellare ATCC 36951]